MDPGHYIVHITDEQYNSIKNRLRKEAADPQYAFTYALYWDQKPHPTTRENACKLPQWAYYYALEVDKKPTPLTKKAVKNSDYKFAYDVYVLPMSKNPVERLKAQIARKKYELFCQYTEWRYQKFYKYRARSHKEFKCADFLENKSWTPFTYGGNK